MWFIISVIFFVLWLSANSAKKRSEKQQYDKGYSEGYWALGTVLKEELAKKTIDRKKLTEYVAVPGDTVSPVIEPAAVMGTESPVAEVYSREDTVATPFLQSTVAAPMVQPIKTKQQIAERNLNILLYMASFLIVAAAAAFIATSMPPVVRLVGLWTVIVAFYLVGLLLHAKVSYLKPAATAFIGTALAVIPFAGIALSQLGGLSAGWAWFITSVVGIISYAFATLQLKSQVVGYLTVAFSLSFAASAVATVDGPSVLYFTALIVVSLIFHIAARSKASWIPALFKIPIEQTSHILTPVTLLGSLLAYDSMTIISYQIVFWVATAHYFVLWLTDRRFIYETVTRVLLSIAAYICVLDIFSFALVPSLVAVLGLVILQSAYSLVRVRTAETTSRIVESTWLGAALATLVFTLPVWLDADTAKLGMIVQVSTGLLLSIAATLRFRNVLYALPALGATVALPFLIGRWPDENWWSVVTLVWVFIGAAAVSLGAYFVLRHRSVEVKQFLQVAYIVYIIVAFLSSFWQGDAALVILSTIGIAVAILAASYIYVQWWIEIISVILTVPIAVLTLRQLGLHAEWLIIGSIAGTTLIYMLALGVHHFTGQFKRRTVLTIATMTIGFGLLFNYGQPELVKIVSLLLALLYAALAIVFRIISNSSALKSVFTAAYSVYPIIMLLQSTALGEGWLALALATIMTIAWGSSYIEKAPLITLIGNGAFIGFIAALWAWAKLDSSWASFGIAWTTAAVFYLTALYYAFSKNDTSRYMIHLVSTWVVLGAVTLVYVFTGGSYGYAAAASLLVISATIAGHALYVKKNGLLEASLYIATFALQRIVGLTFPEATIVLYGHWWAAVLFIVAFWRKDAGYKTRLIVATSFITIGSGLMALTSGESGYQLLFLIEHVALLVAGALSRVSWALWWGLVASVLAVLYFLRSSLFLSLLFLGLTLLGVVIWRLKRAQQKS